MNRATKRTPVGLRLQQLRVQDEGPEAMDTLFEKLSARHIADRADRIVDIEKANATWDAYEAIWDEWPRSVATAELAVSFHTANWAEMESMLSFLSAHLGDTSVIVFAEDPELGGVEWPLTNVLPHAQAFVTFDNTSLVAAAPDATTALHLNYGPVVQEGGRASYSLTLWRNVLDSERQAP